MKNNLIPSVAAMASVVLLGQAARAQTSIYSVNGTGGTGGGTTAVSLTPGTAPSGSSALTDLASGDSSFTFGTGPGGTAGESIVDAATGQAGSGVLAGTLGAAVSESQFTVTMWVNQSTASLNNYRLLEISTGSPATTGTGDGNLLFFGENAGGGLQYYVNAVNGNTVGTDIAAATTWNNGGTLGALANNTWYFEAITYDTVGGSSLLYSGSQSSPAILAYTFNNLAGSMNLSSATSISLLDRFSGGRNFPGAIDDVNLYNSPLTVSQLDAIQTAELGSVPEPGTLALLGVGGVLSLVAAVRRQRR
jgi:hypothetical protein